MALSACGTTLKATSSTPAPKLPQGFSSYSAVRSALLPLIRHGTALPVLLPASIPRNGVVHGAKTVIDASYRASHQGYRLSLFYGVPLPVNSPKVGESGNAGFLMEVRGAPTEADLKVATSFGPTESTIASGTSEAVSLGHGITGTLVTGPLNGGTAYSMTWQEDGWTFVIPSTMGIGGSPVRAATSLASWAEGMKLPGEDGKVVFTFGSDGPSIAIFRLGSAWYSLYANGWQAARFASTMVP